MGQTPPVANDDQARYWNEHGGPSWVANELWFDTMLRPYEEALEVAAAPAFGEYVVDIGCGFGTTTLAMARAVGEEGRVVACDISEVMGDRVRSRATAEGLTNVLVQVGDVQTEPLPADEFHLAVSRFGVMFFDDPVAAFTNVRESLRRGGRLVFTCWQSRAANEFATAVWEAVAPVGSTATPVQGPGPFAFGDEGFVREVLRGAGFGDVRVDPVSKPIVMGGGAGVDAALAQCSGMSEATQAMSGLDEAGRAEALDRLRAMLAAHLVDGAVQLGSAGRVVTARE
jgi:SAM-dependent methyltransferase